MAYTDTIQVITFIKRNPRKTREEFYKHWREVHAPMVAPWAEKHGILSYRQCHSAGTIVPSLNSNSAPNAQGKDGQKIPTTPQEYDGFVIWEVTSLASFNKAFQDPYYIQYIEPDEHNLIDKNSFAAGIIATFSSRFFEVMNAGKTRLSGGNTEPFRKRFEEFEAAQRRSTGGLRSKL